MNYKILVMAGEVTRQNIDCKMNGNIHIIRLI